MKTLKIIGTFIVTALFRLYLIIPFAYALLLLILLLAFGVSFSDSGVTALYVTGVVICFALSGVLIIRKYLFKKKNPKRISERRTAKEQFSTAEARENTDAFKRNNVRQTRNYDDGDEEEVKNPFFEIRRKDDEDERREDTRRPQEKPRLYRTRRDPDLFIAEYSDRLEIYRRKADGQLVLEQTDYKN